ncbi:MAG: PQQ-binding-like beta-propeller repeat protein, partial [Pirellulaceae bacterium]
MAKRTDFITVQTLLLAALSWSACCSTVGADWPQLQGDALRSGNVPEVSLSTPIGLVAAVPLTDAVLAAPVIGNGKVIAVDGAGVVHAIDTQTLDVVWKFSTRGGRGNCNNVAAPALVGKYVHVATMAGYYYVLDCDSGSVVKEIDCREPLFAAPVVGKNRVYFATLGA